MEDESVSHSELCRVEQTNGDESEESTDSCHVAPRQTCAAVSEEERFPFYRQTDSLALLSVYRYAKQIKDFLGWDDDKDDSVQEGCCENASDFTPIRRESLSNGEPVNEKQPSINGDCINQEINTEIAEADDNYSPIKRKESLFGSKPDIGQPSSVAKNSISQEKNDESADEKIDHNCSEDHEGSNKRNSSYLEVADYTEIDSKGDIRAKDPFIAESETNSNPLETDIENVQDSGVLRSEISIIIGNNEAELSLTKNNESLDIDTYPLENSIDENMNEPLVKENCRKVSDVVLSVANDVSMIGLMTTSGDFVNELYTENTKGHETEEEEVMVAEQNQKPLGITNGKTVLEGNAVGEILINKTKENKTAFIEKSEKENFYLLQMKDDVNKEILPQSGKDSINHNAKVNQPKNITVSKTENSFKAYIDYESKEIKNTTSKDFEKNSIHRESTSSIDNTTCGLWFFKPQCIQPCASAKVYVILYSIIGILHGSYYSYLIGTLSTLEKRFAFKSKISGAIMVADEATPLLLGMIVGYYAGKAHRPRIIALGMLLSAACCFCTSLPYFIYGAVQHLTFENVLNSKGAEYCDPASGPESCNASDRPPTLPAVLLLVFGSFLKGFGNLAYYAIGLAYLDDNSEKKSTPIYLAIALALRLLGPLLGFLMSSGFLKLYENPFHDPGYGPEDPRWIGAWWIGFFLQGILLIVFTLPIGLFPRRLPGRKSLAKASSFTTENSLKEIFVGLISALKRLGKNPVFVLLIINTTMKIFGHFGHAIMLPKYMENQFRLSASEASLFSGATSITCIMLSTLLGGFLVWKFRPRLQVLISGMIASETIMCIGFLVLMIPRCKTANMLHFGVDDEGLVLNGVCNTNCDCSTTSFTPFCGQDGETMYFSPCYAGCTKALTSMTSAKNHKEYGNCSCVGSGTQHGIKATISEGFCPDENCWSQTLAYLIILFLVIAISNLFTVVHTMILLRSVHPNDKSVALGTFETFLCLFGFIPFPVTYGALVDSACLVWEKSCGETGNCWFYDMERYRYLLHGASALFCSFSVVCLVLLYFYRSRVRDLYADDDDEGEGTEYVDIKLDTVTSSVTKL